jgi:hypothetical protein
MNFTVIRIKAALEPKDKKNPATKFGSSHIETVESKGY